MSYLNNVIKNSWPWEQVIDNLLITEWVQQLKQFKQIYIAYSGGLDSTVLLHALAKEPSLAKKLKAVHVNHGLSPYAKSWEHHCKQSCQHYNISFLAISVVLKQRSNVEEWARKARYNAFIQLIEDNDCLVTAHHQDDQAETVLLHLFRGTGINGLAGMPPNRMLGKGYLFRPLLGYSRQFLHHYAKTHQLEWIDDESNINVQFSRNYLRHQIIPFLKKKWPSVTNTLARTSYLCQEAQSNLNDLALLDCPHLKTTKNQLSLVGLDDLNASRLNNVLRFWLQLNGVQPPNVSTFRRLMNEVIKAKQDACPEVCWDNMCIKRYQTTLFLLKHSCQETNLNTSWQDFPKPLQLPGVGLLIAKHATEGIVVLPQQKIEVRFRQGGEHLYWHGQTKSLKKLLQHWQIPMWRRQSLPLIYIDNQLAGVVGYAISDNFFSREQPTYQIYLNID